MAIRASNQLPAQALFEAKKVMLDLRRSATQLRNSFTNNGADADTVLGSLASIASVRGRLLTLASVPGIGRFAQDQEDDVNYDIAAEFTALMNLVVAAGVSLAQVVPKSGGYLLSHTLDANGFRVPRSFTAADLAAAISALDTLIAFIE